MIFHKLLTWYHLNYAMPLECKQDCSRKNVQRLTQALPITLFFGVIMVISTLIAENYTNPRFKIHLYYYSTIFLLSSIPLLIIFLQKKKKKLLGKQNILFYFIITLAQCFCLYQRIIGFTSDGYMVWTIITIIIITLFKIHPVFFLVSALVQFSLMVTYEYLYGHAQIFNLTLLVFITVILVFEQWKQTINDFNNIKAINKANEKSDALLHNILPAKVIEDLRKKGTSNPEHFDHVSIMFTDLLDFTDKSCNLTPEYLIGELSDLFTSFDYIAEKYGCTRIKTIGDSYMAVCGLPEPDTDHSKKMVQCAIDCLNYLQSRNKHSKIKWNMRVGIHSGSVVAGIVGSQKYLYDIFGDTVNTASRMEKSSLSMQVNVSEETYNLTKDAFSYKARKPQNIKGKGVMNMYLVQISPPLASLNSIP